MILSERGNVTTELTMQGVRKIAANEAGIAEIANERKALERMDGHYAPRIIRADPAGEWLLEEDLGNGEPVRDEAAFRRSGVRLLERMRELGIKHGDLTHFNLIVRNNTAYAVDWTEASLDGGSTKRPEPDAAHLWPAMASKGIDTARHMRRWIAIRESMSWESIEGCRLVDLGCNTGEMLAMAAAEGATTLGIDWEPDSVADGTRQWPNVGFRLASLWDVEIQQDAALCLSVWPYLVRERGREAATDWLARMVQTVNVLYFETQLSGDGPGPEFLRDENDVADLLGVIAASVEPLVSIPVAGRDAVRTTWKVSRRA